MRVGAVHRLIMLLHDAFGQLQVQVEAKRIEDIAVLVHRAMTMQARNYHNLDHVFTFISSSDPIQTLAALFHDIVYYQVDLGFLPDIREIIAPYIQESGEEISIVDPPPQDDLQFHMTLEVFHLKPGEKLSPRNGLNEFLSAVVMNRELSGLVSDKDLLKMILCVEATIPFRGSTDLGESHFDLMEKKLRQLCKQCQIILTESEVQGAIDLAVLFANKDVENFAEDDVRDFLNITWKLLPEMNVALRSQGVYTIREFRQAIQRTEGFYSSLNPDHVFHRHRGTPSADEFQRITRLAHKNIETTIQYLRIKLLAQAILEALALATGGDAPLSLFMGEIPKPGETVLRLEQFLPVVDPGPWVDRSSTLYELLYAGRSTDAGFDLNTSPLSLFLYRSLTPVQMDRALKLGRELFAGRLGAVEFLSQIDCQVVSAVAWASSQMVPTRRNGLLQYVI
ncbi:MAG: hypothetical protein JXB15_17815 [Anaerolineales bacterium]|nr:hypothetical protein [Anaerolineales bacterium]